MSERTIEPTEEESFTDDVSDSALEAAGGTNEQKGPTSGPPTSRPVYCPC